MKDRIPAAIGNTAVETLDIAAGGISSKASRYDALVALTSVLLILLAILGLRMVLQGPRLIAVALGIVFAVSLACASAQKRIRMHLLLTETRKRKLEQGGGEVRG